MKLNNLKAEIKKLLVRNLVIVAVLLLVFSISFYLDYIGNRKLEQFEKASKDTKFKIIQQKTDYEEAVKMLDEYKALNVSKLANDNAYETGRSRLDLILPLFSELKNTYSFKKLNFSLTEIKKSEKINVGSFTVFENKISIEFSGVSDEYFFSFLNDLASKLPGYINLDSLEINKDKDITASNINSGLTSNDMSFVSGRADLGWYIAKSNTIAPIKNSLEK